MILRQIPFTVSRIIWKVRRKHFFAEILEWCNLLVVLKGRGHTKIEFTLVRIPILALSQKAALFSREKGPTIQIETTDVQILFLKSDMHYYFVSWICLPLRIEFKIIQTFLHSKIYVNSLLHCLDILIALWMFVANLLSSHLDSKNQLWPKNHSL